MNFIPSGCKAIEGTEYDKEIEGWCALNSIFLNEKTHLLILNLLIQMKRQTNKYMVEQRTRGKCFTLQPSISESGRKITLLFDYLEKIEEYTSQ